LTRNQHLQIIGAKAVEQNRNGVILDCFITEQYKILAVAERFRRNPRKRKWRRTLVKTVNEYNSLIGKYSEILRIPINKIEITRLSEKLMSDKPLPLTEIQNFLYARELIETVDKYKTGERLPEREFVNLINELNKRIDKLQMPESMENGDLLVFNNLAGKIRDLGYWISAESSPTPHERYRYKRDLYKVVEELRMGGKLTDVEADAFCRDAFRVVDYLGGRQRRRIIRVLAKDDMIIEPTELDTDKKHKKKSKV
jgi:translation initiation factor IF-1